VSNFLKNLAKRSAGIPLATECLPAPPAFADGFRSGAALDEIALDDVAGLSPDTPTATPSRSINLASSRSRNEIQRAATVDTDTPAPPNQEPATRVQTSLDIDSVHSVTPLSRVRPDSEPGPKSKTLDLNRGLASQDREVDERSETTVHQTNATLQEMTHVESNLRPMISPAREGQTLLPIQVAAKRTAAQTPGTKETSARDQAISPARTERADSLQFPKVARAPTQTTAALPIHVHVGRIEVRGNRPAEAPVHPAPKAAQALGFAGYQRMRRYRS
jgi:hypothetical protein